MANTKLSALSEAIAASGIDELYINESGVSKKITGFQLANFINSSGIIKSLSSDAPGNSSSSMVKVSGIDVSGIGPGTYIFQYYISAQSAHISNSMKFSVNHTGTTTLFMYNLFFTHPAVINNNVELDQEYNATTGAIWAVQSTRIKNTTLGPQTAVDTANASLLYYIHGIIIVTETGVLELYQGSEDNGINTIVEQGTTLILTKVR